MIAMYIDAYYYLHEIRKAYKYIKAKQKALDQYDYMIDISCINYDRDKIQSSPRQDGLELKAIRHMEAVAAIKAEIAEKIEWQARRIDEATTLISQIESKEQREVLIMRYIENKTWAEILEARDCDNIGSQYELHKRAIASLQKVLDGDSIGSK
jgi:hypothetical protein